MSVRFQQKKSRFSVTTLKCVERHLSMLQSVLSVQCCAYKRMATQTSLLCSYFRQNLQGCKQEVLREQQQNSFSKSRTSREV